ncbi:MAG: hypothetical protein AOA66_1716 [Candidatus Bathyarchaeota archaeon BA2]|nr:MAG: hypothetical protein AOA66_1716 [Candidatus Bathyarchaeota archaeon BA2]
MAPSDQEETVRPVGARKYTEEKEQVKVFLSFCERNPKNEYLIEKIVAPFLDELDFEVHYYKKDVSLDMPFKRIEDLINKCNTYNWFLH